MSETVFTTKLLALRCIITLFIFFCVSLFAAAAEEDGEAKALLNWKTSLTKQSQETLSSWNNNGTHNLCRNWKGISCDDDESMSVINISLSNLSLQEIAYVMEANEKCDVYSFGVLTLEIIMGIHPGELILSLMDKSSATFDLLLKDLLDPRLSPPRKSILDEVIAVVRIAFSCLNENPRSRPTMEQVSTELARQPKSRMEDPFVTITIGQLMKD